MKILLTGAAGFIGMHVAQIRLKRGDEVTGIHNLNDYYDPALKLARLEQLKPFPNFRFLKDDISDRMMMEDLFYLAFGLAARCVQTHRTAHPVCSSTVAS